MRTDYAVIAIGASVLLGVLFGAVLALDDGAPADDLTVEWVGDIQTAYGQNHHQVAVATVGEAPVIAAPVNDLDDVDFCGIAAYDADGQVRWHAPLSVDACNPHAIGDVGVADRADGESPAFLAITAERVVAAFDGDDGERTLERPVDSIGYSAPAVADVTGDGIEEIVAVDFEGSVHVVRPDGSLVWDRDLDGRTWADPIVTDVTGDGETEIAVAHGFGHVTVLDREGSVLWQVDLDRPITAWTAIERDAGVDLVAATRADTVLALDPEGRTRWSTSVEGATSVGDPDGTRVYVGDGTGTVSALDLEDGSIEWRRTIVEDVRVEAPAIGDVTGDGSPELVAVARDGTVSVLEPATGDELARHELDDPIYVSPTLADVTGDGADDVVLLFGDGRVALLAVPDG